MLGKLASGSARLATVDWNLGCLVNLDGYASLRNFRSGSVAWELTFGNLASGNLCLDFQRS